MAARVTHSHFEKFAQGRLEFVRNIAALAERPEYLESLLDEDAFGMLKGLLHDRVATVQQTAALAIGRMAGFSIELSEELVKGGILETLTASVRDSTPGHMKAAAFVIRSVAKHTEDLCQCCIETQCCQTMVWCLEQLDVSVREAASQSLAVLASHSASQAAAVVEAGALPLLVGSMQEPEPALKRAAAATLAEVAKHTPELAQAVIEAGALPVLTGMLRHAEAKLRKQAANTLGHIVKHSAVHAEAAVEARLFPAALVCMQDSDLGVRRQASITTREVSKHSQQLASVVVECGGIGSAVEAITTSRPGGAGATSPTAAGAVATAGTHGGHSLSVHGGAGTAAGIRGGKLTGTIGGTATATAALAAASGHTQAGHAGLAGAAVESMRLAPVMTLGFIAAFSENLAQGVVDAGGVQALKTALLEEGEDHVLAAAVWALGQVGKHSASHANALASADVLRHILALLHSDDSSDDLKDKARRCLTLVLSACTHIPAMEALLPSCPGPLAKIILRQFVGVLGSQAEARKAFLASGGLKMVQAFDPAVAAMASGVSIHGANAGVAGMTPAFLQAASSGAADGDTGELLDTLNGLYPAEVVQYCRPDYYHKLSKKIGQELHAEAKAERQGWLKQQYAADLKAESKGDPGHSGAADVAALPNY